MRKYRMSVHIESVDSGPAEHSDIQLGMFSANSIDELVVKASKWHQPETAVEQHNRLAAAEAAAVPENTKVEDAVAPAN